MTTDGLMFRVISTGPERAQVLEFMRAHSQKWYQCDPHPTEGPIITAWQGNDLVGTSTLDLRDAAQPFDLERVYDFAAIRKLMTLPDRTDMIQSGRWFSTVKGVSHLLLQAVAEYAHAKGRHYILGEGKHFTIKRLEQLGFRFIVVYGVLPRVNEMPMVERRFYDYDKDEVDGCAKFILIDSAHILTTTSTRLLEPGSF
jgi:hypothetical protein